MNIGGGGGATAAAGGMELPLLLGPTAELPCSRLLAYGVFRLVVPPLDRETSSNGALMGVDVLGEFRGSTHNTSAEEYSSRFSALTL